MHPCCGSAGRSRSRLALTESCSARADQISHSAFTIAMKSAQPLSPGLGRIPGFVLKIFDAGATGPCHQRPGSMAGDAGLWGSRLAYVFTACRRALAVGED
jgi:hypothetical protein